jgi:hypothetical protein
MEFSLVMRQRLVTLLCVLGSASTLPRHLVGREADALFDNHSATQEGLAREVAAYVARDVDTGTFHTGSTRFDGEWALVTHQMAALGFAQMIRAHPTLRARYVPAIRRAVARVLDERVLRFGRDAWGASPFDDLDEGHGHAYLGYVALAIGALREVDANTPYTARHDRMVETLARKLERAPHHVIETYPGEAYPCDIAAVVGAIGQHARLTHVDRSALIARMATVYRRQWTHHDSGYLAQSVNPRSGAAHDAPRGSGTALAAYFWSFADRDLSRELARSISRHGYTSLAGFGAVREYAPGHAPGHGDIDSGPVLWGVSVSATGFALYAARALRDRERFRGLFRTAALFGIPVQRREGWRFATGGPIGNAILFAMLTAEAP